MKKRKLMKRIKKLEQQVGDLELGQSALFSYVEQLIGKVCAPSREAPMPHVDAVEPVAKKVSREDDPDPDLLGDYDIDFRTMIGGDDDNW